MATKQEYILAIYELDNKFKQVLNSKNDENSRIYLRRFKSFIETNNIIKAISDDLTKGKVALSLNKFLVKYPHNMYFSIVVPDDIGVHILTMYKLIENICNKNIIASKSGVFLLPGCSSNKVVDKLFHFLNNTLKPLYQYLREELKKRKIMSDKDLNLNSGIIVNQTINGDGNLVTYSARDSFVNGQALKEMEDDLKLLIEKAMQELTNINIDEDEKESLVDDLETLKSEINEEKPKIIRFKKIKKNIDSFISSTDETLKKSVGLLDALTLITTKLNKLLSL